jgi:hypothetical protein
MRPKKRKELSKVGTTRKEIGASGSEVTAPRRSHVAHLHRPWRATEINDLDVFFRPLGVDDFTAVAP